MMKIKRMMKMKMNKQQTTNKKQSNKIGFDAQRKKFLFELVVQ